MDIPRRDRTLQKNAEALRLRYNFDETFITTDDMPFSFEQGGTNVTSEASFKLYLKSYFNELMPCGMMFDWLSADVPTGYLAADGAAVSRETYADLFTAIGTTYGVGDGSTTFNLPDTRGMVTVDLDSTQTEFDAIGEKGGAKTHTLSVGEIPSLSLELLVNGNGSSPYGISAVSSGNAGFVAGYVRKSGDAAAFNIMPPYIVVKKIIKY